MSVMKGWSQSAQTPSPSWGPPLNTDSTRRSPVENSVSPNFSRKTSSRSSRSTLASINLHHSEASIQRQLQILIDAQADGLLASLGIQDIQDADAQSSEEGDANEASTSFQHGKVVPIRQPNGRPMSLRAARRGIRNAMLQLAAIKSTEVENTDAAIEHTVNSLERFTLWEKRKKALEQEIEKIHNHESTTRVLQLKEEDQTLQQQINDIEEQLARLKGQQNTVRLELTRITNSVDSKLSSYQQSLKLLEGQIADSLRHSKHVSGMSESAYLSLPLERRTLEMAVDDAQDRQQALKQQKQILADEVEAVEAGITIWSDSIEAITSFELSLKEKMETSSKRRNDEPVAAHEDDAQLQDILRKMDDIITDLDSKVKLADARGWKLLVVTVGAELEAFGQARDILRGSSLPIGHNNDQSKDGHDHSEASSNSGNAALHFHPVNDTIPDNMRNSSSTILAYQHPRPARYGKDDDDEPSMDLLDSSRDDDSE